MVLHFVLRLHHAWDMTDFHKVLLTLAFGTLGFSCSVVVDAERVQCSTDADCTGRGGEFANTVCSKNFCEAVDEWSCSKHPAQSSQSKQPVRIDFALFDAVSSMTVADVDAKLCGKLDLDCAAPLSTMKTGADGVVAFDVAPLFDGYVQLNRDGYDPTLMFLPAVTESVSLGEFPYTVSSAAAFLGTQLGKPLLPEAGRVLTTITGCDKELASGVSLEGENMGADAAVFYAVDGFPSFSATETDGSGFAGFVNVAPGSITLNASIGGGRRVGRAAIFVRAQYVSIRRIQPWTD